MTDGQLHEAVILLIRKQERLEREMAALRSQRPAEGRVVPPVLELISDAFREVAGTGEPFTASQLLSEIQDRERAARVTGDILQDVDLMNSLSITSPKNMGHWLRKLEKAGHLTKTGRIDGVNAWTFK